MRQFYKLAFTFLVSAPILSGCNDDGKNSTSTFETNVVVSNESAGGTSDEKNITGNKDTFGTTETQLPNPSLNSKNEVEPDPDVMIVIPEEKSPFKVKTEIIDFTIEGTKVIGTLTLPVKSSPAPVILLLHGYTGACGKDDVKGTGEKLFGRTARLWAIEGYASLCIDYRGSGRSATSAFTWADTTFETQIVDAAAAVSFLHSDKRVDGNWIAAVGWSQGGLIAAGLAGRTPSLRAVGLWNAITIPVQTYANILGKGSINILRKGAVAAADAATRDDIVAQGLKAPFFEGIYSVDPVAEIARYHGPLFVSAGTADEVVEPQPLLGNLLLKYHDGEEEIWVRRMDHHFETGTSAVLFDEMLAATLSFLRKGLDAKDQKPAT